MKMYSMNDYFDYEDESGCFKVTLYFKTKFDVDFWFQFAPSDNLEYDIITEVDCDIDSLWLVGVDGVTSCYIDSDDLVDFIKYLKYFGHKVVVE